MLRTAGGTPQRRHLRGAVGPMLWSLFPIGLSGHLQLNALWLYHRESAGAECAQLPYDEKTSVPHGQGKPPACTRSAPQCLARRWINSTRSRQKWETYIQRSSADRTWSSRLINDRECALHHSCQSDSDVDDAIDVGREG